MNKISNLEEFKKFSEDFALSLDKKELNVVGLYGNLGAGKTTFSQIVSKVLGVTENVSSPTFVIMKIYELSLKKWKRLVHIDAYRIEKESELLHLGFKEIVNDKENLVLIEWPEKVSGIMPDHIKVYIDLDSDGLRTINII
jgi:tRNA threonylcarbamoyladenosine biosynthesis protein TsaE